MEEFKDGELKFVEDDLLSELAIDRMNLDVICENHSELFAGVALARATATSFHKRAELIVKETKAEVGNLIRTERLEEGLKTTENQLMELIDMNATIKKARKWRLETGSILGKMEALLTAFEHRRSMINNEVQMLITNTARATGESNTQRMNESIRKKRDKKE